MAYIGSPFTFDSRLPDPGVTDQVLKSDGAGNWTTADPAHLELPTPGPAGKVLSSDGTNWVSVKATDALTTDLPPGTAGKLLKSDGATWVSGDAPDPLPAGALDEVLTHDGTNWTSAAATGGGGAGGSTDVIASGTLADGNPVVLMADGRVEIISNPISALNVPLADDGATTRTQAHTSGTSATWSSVDFDPNDQNKFVLIHRESMMGTMVAKVGVISGSSITFPLGDYLMGSQGHGYSPKVKYHTAQFTDPMTMEARPIIGIFQGNGLNGMNCTTLTYGGSSGLYATASQDIGMPGSMMTSMGMPMDFNGAYTSADWDTAYSGSGNAKYRFLMSWEANHDPMMGSDSESYLIAGTCAEDGTGITFGTQNTPAHWLKTSTGMMTWSQYERPIAFDPNTAGKFAYIHFSDLAPYDTGFNGDLRLRIGNISGTTINLNTNAVQLDLSVGGWNRNSHAELMWNTSVSDVLVASWVEGGSMNNRPQFVIATVSGNTPTMGARHEVDTTNKQTMVPWRLLEFNADKIYATGYALNGIYHQAFSWTGTTISSPYARTLISHPAHGVVSDVAWNYQRSHVAASDGVNSIIAYYFPNNGAPNYPNAELTQSTFFGAAGSNLTADNFLGISSGVYADGTTATIQLPGAVDDAQSGLTIGTNYFLQPDGVLSATANTPEVLVGTAMSATSILIADNKAFGESKVSAAAAVAAHGVTRVAAEATVLASAATDATTKADAAQVAATASATAAAYAVDTLQVVAAGALADGSKVILKPDGAGGMKAELINDSDMPIDAPTTDNDGFVQPKNMWFNGQYAKADTSGVSQFPMQKPYLDWDPFDENRFIMAYSDQAPGSGWNNQKYVVGTISGTTISFAAANDIDTTNDASPVAMQFSPITPNLIGCAYGANHTHPTDPLATPSSPIVKFGQINASNVIVWGSTTSLHAGASYGSSVPDWLKGNFSFDWDYNSSSGLDNSGDNKNHFILVYDTWFDFAGGINYRQPTVRAGTVADDGTQPDLGTATSPRGLYTHGNYAWGGAQIKSIRFDPNTHKKFLMTHHYPSGGGGAGQALHIGNLDGNNYPSLGSEIQLTGQGVDNSDDGISCEWNPGIPNQIVFSGKTYNPGTMCVGTVSGTSVSWGTKFTPYATNWEASHPGFTGPSYAWQIFFGLGGAAGRFYGVTTPFSSSADLICQAFNITGTTITEVGSPVSIAPHAWLDGTTAQPWHCGGASKSGMKIIVSSHLASGSTKLTTGTIGQSGVANLTETNFLGISDGVYTAGATATIQLSGATDDAQSGLTAGSTYYIRPNGTLDTTANTPSVYAGQALSATELLIGATRPSRPDLFHATADGSISNGDKIIIRTDGKVSGLPSADPISGTNLTTSNYIGIADADYADGATASIQIRGHIDDAQSGLTIGTEYFVQSDGTLAVTADAVGSISAGTALAATKILIA